MCGCRNKLRKLKIQEQSEEGNIIKNIRDIFKPKKENEAIKDHIIRDLRSLFEQEDNYYKPIKVDNFWKDNFIEYESNCDKNKNLSVKEYFNEIKPYVKYIIAKFRKSGTWKFQLAIAINFISSKATNEEHGVMTHDKANVVINNIFESLHSRYQISLETSMKGSNSTIALHMPQYKFQMR